MRADDSQKLLSFPATTRSRSIALYAIGIASLSLSAPRGMAIAVFYAIGTGAGGVVAPALFSALVGSGSRTGVMGGYLLGAGLMTFAGIVAAFLALPAEGRSLEEIARRVHHLAGLCAFLKRI